MRQDTWAWYRIGDTLECLALFLQDITRGAAEEAYVHHLYMMRWHDEDLSMSLHQNGVL